MHVCIISDGYSALESMKESPLSVYERARIHDYKEVKAGYKWKKMDKEGNTTQEGWYHLKFINASNMSGFNPPPEEDDSDEDIEETKGRQNTQRSAKAQEEPVNNYWRSYGTNNIGHCFSRAIKFEEWVNSLTPEDQRTLSIDNYSVYDFLYGSDKPGKVKNLKYTSLAMPIHFMIKHSNKGKIESHKWFFKGFCEYMQPEFAQILDCGSIPLWNSISHLVMHMETYPNVGGSCGEIECLLLEKTETGQQVSFVESVILRAQYVEYKVSHYLDKATESLFGFVSVLPGAFSTFRWECINGTPLEEFLKGSKDDFVKEDFIMPCHTANKYLAEDRIMCLEIIAKKGRTFSKRASNLNESKE